MTTLFDGRSNYTINGTGVVAVAEFQDEFIVPITAPILIAATLFITTLDADCSAVNVTLSWNTVPALPTFVVPAATVVTTLVGVIPIPSVIIPPGQSTEDGGPELDIQLVGQTGPTTGIYSTIAVTFND